ncbi:hypothetical protein PHYSODRAFT_285270 [Phytophthora sojae]|uniref:RxLR effector protein n=2 Tax=Phytophthora sojae TaxID=67593 RepID=G4Z3K5_PHYSP|nr:hypothetical protein PHYSODRAFT_285270 [Phytophthora sojae]AEK80975.1 Avh227 [Phytophthora sojae]AEK80976.1 Avh227 [Phytophthora sojae]AEK80977.1 Avh227 [Phytophthora sojae]EGZ19377.1 hypothetical protein PHYSODRAFT_285270 [Phytophthora sojae]|eukprot:XP_009522094.1 hypothetical protein PHYSODRAFT_285270 [Phytophthora sojae]
MRSSFLVLLLLAILHASRAAAPTSPPVFQQGHPELGDNSERRLLRSFRTDEERAASLAEKLKKLLGLSKTAATNAVDDFAEAIIQKMLKSDKFNRNMFKKWDKYSLEQIKTKVDRTKYAEPLLEYAKKFRSYKKWK